MIVSEKQLGRITFSWSCHSKFFIVIKINGIGSFFHVNVYSNVKLCIDFVKLVITIFE